MCGMCLFWLALAGFECLLENLIFKSGKCPKGMSLLYLQLLAIACAWTFFIFFNCLCLSKIKGTTIKICDNRRLVVTAWFAFCIITFQPIEVQTRLSSRTLPSREVPGRSRDGTGQDRA